MSDVVDVVVVGIPGPAGPPSLDAGAIVTTRDVTIVGDPTGTAATIPISINVRNYGAVGDGSTDDTAALAAAFARADAVSRPVLLPAGTYLTDTIEYAGQSIIGDGSNFSILKGKASQDVLHVDPSVSQFYREGMTLQGFKIIVNDTVDASASFPNRGGVGNAGFAVDYANGASAAPLMMIHSKWNDLVITSSSQTTYGQNKSCGIYTQFQTLNLAALRNIEIDRLVYGWWDHYPTSNVTSSEHARDHVKVDNIRFYVCGNPWRIVNANEWQVGTATFHTTTGVPITFHGITSSIRDTSFQVQFKNVMIENCDTPFAFTGNVPQHINFDGLDVGLSTNPVVWAAHVSTIKNTRINIVGSPDLQLTVTGNQNIIEFVGETSSAAYSWDAVADTGAGNRITMIATANATAAQRFPSRISRGIPERHVPDASSLMQGIVDPMYVGSGDLIAHPLQFAPDYGAYVLNTDYSYVTDAAADYGVAFRHLASGHLLMSDGGFNGVVGLRVGKTFPKGKMRCYVKAKANSAGTHNFGINDFSFNDLGSAYLTLTTSYVVYSWEADLSSLALDASFLIYSQSPSASRPVDVAWMAFRPYNKDVLIDGVLKLSPITLPGTCVVGEMCVDTADKKVKVCTAANTWTIVGSQ